MNLVAPFVVQHFKNIGLHPCPKCQECVICPSPDISVHNQSDLADLIYYPCSDDVEDIIYYPVLSPGPQSCNMPYYNDNVIQGWRIKLLSTLIKTNSIVYWRKQFNKVIDELNNPRTFRLLFSSFSIAHLHTIVNKFTNRSGYTWDKLGSTEFVHLLSKEELLSYYALSYTQRHLNQILYCLVQSSPIRCYNNCFNDTKFIFVLTDSWVDNFTIKHLKQHNFTSTEEELASYANPHILEKKWNEIQQCLEKDNFHCIVETLVHNDGHVHVHLAVPYHFPSKFCISYWDIRGFRTNRHTSISYKRDEWDLHDTYTGHQSQLIWF